ncbi:MAG: ribonuclease III [Burkholderiales bacterium]
MQSSIDYRFENIELLNEALRHRSFGQPNNERLEFLGDSILNCLVSGELFSRYPDLREGELSRLRANHVRQESLHHIARELNLGSFLQLGEGELKSGGGSRPSILADAFEALVGAVYLDGGFAAAQKVVQLLLGEALGQGNAESFEKDPKTQLQEILQARRLKLPKYSVVATLGAAHAQQFAVECVIDALSIRTKGLGANRRAAEQQAAQLAFKKISDGR